MGPAADPAAGDRPVTVGVDGTDGSATALRWAAGEARGRGRPLRIVHAAPHLGAPTGADLHAYATSVLGHARQVVRDLDASLVVQDELARAEPVPALLAAAASSALLVLGSRDAAREATGVGQEVIGRAGCPVVVVPGAAGGTGRAHGAPVQNPQGRAELGPAHPHPRGTP